MEISEAVLEMNHRVTDRDWDGLEKHYAEVAKNSDFMASDLIVRMYELDFRSYEDAIQRGLTKAVEEAKNTEGRVQAIYFQFSLFKMWRSQFQLCDDYIPRNKLNDAWAHDYLSRVRGPSFPILSDLYQRTNLLEESSARLSVGMALVAKTVASIGRAFDRFSDENAEGFPYAFCASFSGQDPVFRIAELS